MVDTWIPISDAADRLGLSRQALHRRAHRLAEVGLARQAAGARWEIAETALRGYQDSGVWPERDPAAEATELDDVMQLRVDLAIADRHAAELGARDATIAARDAQVVALHQQVDALTRQLGALRAEYAEILRARAASLE